MSVYISFCSTFDHRNSLDLRERRRKMLFYLLEKLSSWFFYFSFCFTFASICRTWVWRKDSGRSVITDIPRWHLHGSTWCDVMLERNTTESPGRRWFTLTTFCLFYWNHHLSFKQKSVSINSFTSTLFNQTSTQSLVFMKQ